jgi:hypothetical protein
MDECPVCLSPLSGTITTVGCCKKQFHTQCLLKCTDQKNECPMCRAKDVIEKYQEVVVQVPEEEHVYRKGLYWVCSVSMVVATVIIIKHYFPN